MQKSNTFYIFDREDWKSLNTAENFSMTDEELEELSKNLKTIVKVMEKVGDENEYTR